MLVTIPSTPMAMLTFCLRQAKHQKLISFFWHRTNKAGFEIAVWIEHEANLPISNSNSSRSSFAPRQSAVFA